MSIRHVSHSSHQQTRRRMPAAPRCSPSGRHRRCLQMTSLWQLWNITSPISWRHGWLDGFCLNLVQLTCSVQAEHRRLVNNKLRFEVSTLRLGSRKLEPELPCTAADERTASKLRAIPYSRTYCHLQAAHDLRRSGAPCGFEWHAAHPASARLLVPAWCIWLWLAVHGVVAVIAACVPRGRYEPPRCDAGRDWISARECRWC